MQHETAAEIEEDVKPEEAAETERGAANPVREQMSGYIPMPEFIPAPAPLEPRRVVPPKTVREAQAERDMLMGSIPGGRARNPYLQMSAMGGGISQEEDVQTTLRSREAKQRGRSSENRSTYRGSGKGSKRYKIMLVPEDGEKVRTINTSADMMLVCTVILGVLLALLLVYVIHNGARNREHEEQVESLNELITTLSEDNIVLQAQIEQLDQSLRETNKQISEKENIDMAEDEEQALRYIPSSLPVNSNSMPSAYDKEKKCIMFEAGSGAHVVAAGEGVVTYAGDSVEEGGYLVTVDHGNGYETDYYCKAAPIVKEKNEVTRGTTLFILDQDSGRLMYRIRYEGDFIDPYTVMNISG